MNETKLGLHVIDGSSAWTKPHWYAIAAVADVPRARPLGVERLGRRLVLWRDEQGEVRCLPAACPHRGADLSLGRVQAGEIECPYHGFRFAGSGRCTAIPCEGREAKIPPKLHVQAPTIRVAHGLVWLWAGAEQPTCEPPWIEGAPEPSPATGTAAWIWTVPFVRVMEGMQDIHHLPFAHRKIDPFRRARLDPLEVHVEGDHIRQQGVLRHEHEAPERGFAFDFHCVYPGLLRIDFTARMGGTVAVCPIDEQRTWIWACYRVRTGLGAWIDRAAGWLSLRGELAFVQPDDERMLISSGPATDVQAMGLVRADEAIAAWHKLHRRRASEHSPASELRREGTSG